MKVEALENDIYCLFKNCEYYNYEDSPIVITANALKDKLLSMIRDQEDNNEDFPVSSSMGNVKKRKLDNADSTVNSDGNILRTKVKNRENNSLVQISEMQTQLTNQENRDVDSEEHESVLKIRWPKKINSDHDDDKNNSSNRMMRSKRNVKYSEDEEGSNEESDNNNDSNSESSNRSLHRRNRNTSNRNTVVRKSSRNSRKQTSDSEEIYEFINPSKSDRIDRKVEKRMDPQVRKEILRILSFLDEIDDEKQFFADPITGTYIS